MTGSPDVMLRISGPSGPANCRWNAFLPWQMLHLRQVCRWLFERGGSEPILLSLLLNKKRTVVVCTQVYTLACWIQHWTYTATHIDMYTIKVLLPSERVEPSQPMGWELMSAGCFWHLLGAPALQQSGVAPVAGGWIGIFFLQFEQRPWHLHDSEEQNEGGLVISSNHACCLVAQRTTVWLSKGKKLWSHTRSGSGLIVTDSTSCSPIQNNLGLRPRRCLLACQQVRWDSPAEWRDFFCDWPNARHGIC